MSRRPTITLADAERQVSTLGPDPVHNLSRLLQDRERRAARNVASAAAALDPEHPELSTLPEQQRLDEAVTDYTRAEALAEAVPRIIVRSEPGPWDDPTGPNKWFSDNIRALIPSTSPMHSAARERVERERRRAEVEGRAVGSGAFGTLVVPKIAEEQAAPAVRPGAPFVAALPTFDLPPGGVSGDVPHATTDSGPVAAPQGSENSSTTSVDVDFTTATLYFTTAAARAEVSLQVIDRLSNIGQAFFYRDIREAVRNDLDDQVLNGAGTGGALLGVRSAAATAVTWTDASPTRAEFLSRIHRTLGDVAGVRRRLPDVVVMHSRRFAWLAGGTVSGSTDAAAVGLQVDLSPVAGTPFVGRLGPLGIVVDDHLPATEGTGEDEDVVVVTKADDLVLLVDPTPRVLLDFETRANEIGCTVNAFQDAMFSPSRFRNTSTGTLGGTGLVDPGSW